MMERYKLSIGEDTEGYITDKIEHKTYFLRSDNVKKEITEILNQFYNENEDLKTDISVLNRHYDEYEKICTKLKRENEHLKKSVKRQQNSNNECAKLIEKQQKENEQLKKENELLKQDLEHCANQFTNDGKNVLLGLK